MLKTKWKLYRTFVINIARKKDFCLNLFILYLLFYLYVLLNITIIHYTRVVKADYSFLIPTGFAF